MLSCKYILKNMSLYIDKYLSDKEMNDFKEHIKNCKKCKKELENTEELINNLKNLKKFNVPENFHKDLIDKIKNIKVKKQSSFYKLNLIAAILIFFIFLNNFLILFISEKISFKNIKNKNIKVSEINLKSNINYDNLNTEQEDYFIRTNLEIKTYNMEKSISKLENILNLNKTKSNRKKDKTLYINKVMDIDDYNKIIKNIDKIGTVIFKEEIYKNNEKEEKIKYSIGLYKKEREKLLSLLNNNISEEDKENVNIYINNLTEIIENKNKQLLKGKINNKVNLNLKIYRQNKNEKFYLDIKKRFCESFLNRRDFTLKNIVLIISLIFIVNIIFYFFKRRIKYDK